MGMLLLALLLQAATPRMPAPSLHGGPAEQTCPIGGEKFSVWQPSMYSIYGERPDGRPYSYLRFPFPLPECPSNHLVVFEPFDAADLTRLSTLIATPDYRALATTEPAYYRAYWLATKLDRPDATALGLLLSAIWEVTPGDMGPLETPVTKAKLQRYQEEFVQRVKALPPTTSATGRRWMQARSANASRQLGKFHDADRMRKAALATLGETPDRAGWDTYLATLGVVIARRDVSPEPLDMIPRQQVAFACLDRAPGSDFDRQTCAKPDIAARVAELRTMREKADAAERSAPKPSR